MHRPLVTAVDDSVRRLRAERVDVVSAYRFYMFSLAQQLHGRGQLGRLITAMPLSQISEVPHRNIASRPPLALVRNAIGRVLNRPAGQTPFSAVVDERMNRAVIRDFDRWGATQLGTARAVTALSSFGTQTLGRAKALGRRVIVDRGSQHILEQKRILEEEAARWEVPSPRFDGWIVERELLDYEQADVIMVPSTSVRRSFLRRGVSSGRVVTVPFGVDIGAYTPPADTDHRVDSTVISVGTICIRKGQQYLASATSGLGIDLKLVGPMDPFFPRQLLTGDVRLTGPVPRQRVADEMQRSRIFALASVEEGLALVIPQAMACGLPIVATKSTGAEDIVEHGVSGFIVDDRDTDALAGALEKLVSDPELARSMGHAARQRVAGSNGLGGWREYGKRAAAVLLDEEG